MIAAEMRAPVECVTPVFQVKNLARSIAFYEKVLGFKLEWTNRTICGVGRDGHTLMLSEQGESQGPSVAWIGFDVDDLLNRADALNLRILEGPENKPWAYQVKIADPDGNMLWLAAKPKSTDGVGR